MLMEHIPDDETRNLLNLNPRSIGFWRLIVEDLKTHRNDPLSQGFLAIATHRFGNLAKSIRPVRLMKMIYLLYKIVNRLVEFATGITILGNCIIGRRVHIWHHSCIVINANIICDDVQIRQGTTIGQLFSGGERPTIRNGVDIGCNTVIVGGVVVGEYSKVGALCLVSSDVAPNSKVSVTKIPPLSHEYS